MKTFSIITIVISSLFLLLNVIWMAMGETDMEIGIAFWGFAMCGYLLAYSIVSLVKISKNAK